MIKPGAPLSSVEAEAATELQMTMASIMEVAGAVAGLTVADMDLDPASNRDKGGRAVHLELMLAGANLVVALCDKLRPALATLSQSAEAGGGPHGSS